MPTKIRDLPPEEQVAAVKAAFCAQIAAALPPPTLARVVPYEPARNNDFPMLSMMTANFARAALETPDIPRGRGIADPLDGREWVWAFSVRLWVDMKTDEERAQRITDELLPQIVDALEASRSLGGVVDDSALVTGTVGVVTGERGIPLVLSMLDLEVGWVEQGPTR